MGRHSDDYAQSRPGFPASFYQRLDALRPEHRVWCVVAGTPGDAAPRAALELSAADAVD